MESGFKLFIRPSMHFFGKDQEKSHVNMKLELCSLETLLLKGSKYQSKSTQSLPNLHTESNSGPGVFPCVCQSVNTNQQIHMPCRDVLLHLFLQTPFFSIKIKKKKKELL